MRALMLFVFSVAVSIAFAANASSVITYQGLLNQGGSPFSGTIGEMSFELYDAEIGGTRVAGPVIVSNVIVSQGMFQAELEFDASAFESSARWLQIIIDGTELTPRQRITSVPFAIKALTATEVPGTPCELEGAGDPCTAGIGTCERIGFMVCNSEGTALECNAIAGEPGIEICDGLDNSCDGTIDSPWLNLATGFYDHNEACGSCSVDCTQLLDLANASGACSTSEGPPACLMNCDEGAFDLNGALADGCEFILDPDAIYVSVQDSAAADSPSCGLGPVQTGSGRFPCSSVTAGVTRAVAIGRSKVLVAQGHYVERVVLSNGIDLFGGYRYDTWERVGGGTTLLDAPGAGHRKTLVASNINLPTKVNDFIIQGRTPTTVGANSYAVWIVNSTSALSIDNNHIAAGSGASGTDGLSGAAGQPGVPGLGRDSDSTGFDALVATGAGFCNVSNNRQHASGGTLTCGGIDVSGGSGGGNQCPPSNDFSVASGVPGFAGLPSGGAGGNAGFDARLSSAGTVCQAPNILAAADGNDGGSGNAGGSGSGCSTGLGSIVGNEWTGSPGVGGFAGSAGSGGGGGGGGGGARCESCAENKDRLGAHGGGGGSGGCGGGGGSGAGAGGASIGLFIVGGASPPTLAGNTIIGGFGGAGGRGGNGSVGGFGGMGGIGGQAIFCAGAGGNGGRGGDGGAGGGGGGGCGGPSFGVYYQGTGSPSYCLSNNVSIGTGGPSGAGGTSLGNSGGGGIAGPALGCHSS